DAILQADLLNAQDLNLRKAALLAVASIPSSDKAAQALVQVAENEENAKDPYLPQAVFAAALSHPATVTEQTRQNQPIAKADSLMSLSERVMKGLLSEQYPLDRRAQLQFPPDVAGKEITINAVISKGDEAMEGVIVAQGGKDRKSTRLNSSHAKISYAVVCLKK